MTLAIEKQERLADDAGAAVDLLHLSDGRKLVLKQYGHEIGALKEHRAYERLRGKGLPVPDLVDFEPREEDGHLGWSLMTVAPGIPLIDRYRRLSATDLERIYEGVGRFQRQLHRISTIGFSAVLDLAGSDQSNASHVRQHFERSVAQFIAIGGRPQIAVRLLTYLYEVGSDLDDVSAPVFCHGGLHPGNIRIAKVDGKWCFVGAIDFDESFAGDPSADLARTLHACPRARRRVFNALLRGYGGKPRGFDRLLDLYFLHLEVRSCDVHGRFNFGWRCRVDVLRMRRLMNGTSRLTKWRTPSRRRGVVARVASPIYINEPRRSRTKKTKALR